MSVVAKSYFDVVGASQDEGIKCEDPSLAVQASREETDINYIIKRYLRTGQRPEERQGIYADISEFVDLREAMHQANLAQELFMELPADVRREFDNDPRKLVDFAADSRNRDRAIELGLIEKPSDWQSPQERELLAKLRAAEAVKAGQPPQGAVPPITT